MKNIFKLLSLASIICFGLISCDEDETTFEPLNFPADTFVSVSGGSAEALESNANPIAIIVNLSTNIENTSAATNVDFTLTSDNAVEGVDYMVVDNKTSFEFAPGQFSDRLEIIPVDNLMEDGDKVIVLTLTNSTAALGFPGPDGNGKTFTITLRDDDCVFTLQELGNAAWGGVDTVPGSQAGPNESQITASYVDPNLLLEGISYAWLTDTSYWDEVVVVSNPVITEVDLITGVVNIEKQFLCTTTWLGDVQDDYFLSATGQYVSCSQTMTINYTLYQGADLASSGIRRQFSEIISF